MGYPRHDAIIVTVNGYVFKGGITVLPADPPYRAGYEVSGLLHVKAAS